MLNGIVWPQPTAADEVVKEVGELSVSGRPRHILHVLWDELPMPERSDSASTFAATLVEAGHRVTILTSVIWTGGLDKPSVVGGSAAGTRIIRVPVYDERSDPIINRWSHDRVVDVAAWRAATRVPAESVGERAELWIARAQAVAFAMQENDPIDIAIATVPAYVTLPVVTLLESELQIPFILHVADPQSFLKSDETEGGGLEWAAPWLKHALLASRDVWASAPQTFQCDHPRLDRARPTPQGSELVAELESRLSH